MAIDSKSWAPGRPNNFPYPVYVERDIRFGGGITKWLLENIGISEADWDYEWLSGVICFKTEEDKVKFILRWL